jgi:hypothetical protein
VIASILGVVHAVGVPVRQLDFYDEEILIYNLKRHRLKNKLLRRAQYSDVKRLHYSPPGTLLGGGMGIMDMGLSQMKTQAVIEMSILKFHEALREGHLWDDLTNTDHFVVSSYEESKFEEIYMWVRDRVKEKGGKL